MVHKEIKYTLSTADVPNYLRHFEKKIEIAYNFKPTGIFNLLLS